MSEPYKLPSKNKLVLQAINGSFIFDVLQFWFYLDLCKANIFSSISPHVMEIPYVDKLKN